MRIIPFIVLALLCGELHAQSRKGTFALVNARIVTVTGGTIEGGLLLVQDGKIAQLGAGLTAPSGAEIIDCSGLSIYPGFIDGGTQLGLVEVGSLPETRDDDELGDITPHVQALTAINPNSVSIPVTRVNGVTTVLTAPDGGLFSGTAALINLHGYTPEQMHLGGFRGVVLNFPSSGRRGWWDERPEEEVQKTSKKAREKLDQIWERTLLYARIDSAYRSKPDPERLPEYLPEIESLLPAIRGQMPLLIEVNAARDIDSAIAWVKSRRVRAVFTGVSEGWRIADKIAAAGIPCIVGPVLSIPTRGSDRYDKGYANAGLLRAAGVKVAIRTSESANVRNLPYHAGFAAAYGMGKDEALRAVTIVPAEIFGVDNLVGSLEVGKRANLFVADGDPFEPATSIRHIMIDGYLITPGSRHVELYQEFIKREPGVKK